MSAAELLDKSLPLVESGSIRAWATSQRDVWESIAGEWLQNRAKFDGLSELFRQRPGEAPEHRFAAYIVATAIGMVR